MSNPWLSIPLEDYEGHMASAGVGQLTVLAELFQCVLDRYRPESVAVLGMAGGNGLDQIDPTVTKRIVGLDINQQYLDEIKRRFDTIAGLELHCCDLAERKLNLTPVALVHAALIFEHVGDRYRAGKCAFARRHGRQTIPSAAVAEQRGTRRRLYTLHIHANAETRLRAGRRS